MTAAKLPPAAQVDECDCAEAWLRLDSYDPHCGFHARFAKCQYCETKVDPEVCWEVYDTPVGSFEILTCDEHEQRPELLPKGWADTVRLCLAQPVVHGQVSE